MPREFTRSDRVSDAIQRLLAQVIPAEIRDPRVGMLNINEVTVTRYGLCKSVRDFCGCQR
jgi:ribosome-binding factor A